MVKAPRATARPGALRSLNLPELLDVQADALGVPAAVMLHRRRWQVREIQDVWRVEEGWWRGEPVSRTYFRVVLNDGRQLTTFHDRATGQWYQQRYA